MMKKLKSLLYLALAGLQMLAFAACGPRENENDANKTKLKVSYFKAGYGEEWIVQTAKAFEKKHPDVQSCVRRQLRYGKYCKDAF